MTKDNWPSVEMLNSLIDGELCEQERREIYALMEKDEILSKQVCELRHVKAMVQLAYPQTCEQKVPRIASRHYIRWRGRSIAASLLVLVLLASGWMLFFPSNVKFEGANYSPSSTQVPAQHILLHLTTPDKEAMHEMLIDIEGLFDTALRSGNHLEIQVIAHGDGINLLRSDTSPYPDMIKFLSSRYQGLTFVACRNTIDRLRHDHGIVVELLPEAVIIDSGVAEVIKRQQEGWAYIQV